MSLSKELSAAVHSNTQVSPKHSEHQMCTTAPSLLVDTWAVDSTENNNGFDKFVKAERAILNTQTLDM